MDYIHFTSLRIGSLESGNGKTFNMICRNILRFVCFIVPILPHINGIVISRNNACNNRYPYARVVPSINTRTAVQSVVSNNNHIQDATDSSLLRRRAFTKAISVFASTIFCLVDKSNALEKRNEVLCGTGFFTNIYQEKCTDIGDISNEGKTTTLSNTEETSTNSLMMKFNNEVSGNSKDVTDSKISSDGGAKDVTKKKSNKEKYGKE